MPGVRAGTDPRVAVLHDGQDVIRVPHAVVRAVRALGMIVKADPDIVFLNQLLDGINRIHGFRGDAVEAEFFGELESLARFGLIFGNVHHAVVHRLDVIFGELGLHLLDDVIRRVVVPFHIRFLRTEFLPWIKLDDPAAGLRRLLNRFEDAEPVEGVGLATHGETAGLVFAGNFFGGNGRGGEQHCQRGEQMECE